MSPGELQSLSCIAICILIVVVGLAATEESMEHMHSDEGLGNQQFRLVHQLVTSSTVP